MTGCDGCPGKIFDFKASNTFNISNTSVSLQYRADLFDGVSNIEGYEMTEDLYLDVNAAAKLKFPMVGAYVVKDGSWMVSDGVFGLGRGEDGSSKTLDALYDASLISNKMFTLSLDNPKVDSHLVIGGIPSHILYENITWNKLSDN